MGEHCVCSNLFLPENERDWEEVFGVEAMTICGPIFSFSSGNSQHPQVAPSLYVAKEKLELRVPFASGKTKQNKNITWVYLYM